MLFGWHDPRLNGGQFLDVRLVFVFHVITRIDFIFQFTTPDSGEPLNVIISGLSDPYILTDYGFRDYTKYCWSSGPSCNPILTTIF